MRSVEDLRRLSALLDDALEHPNIARLYDAGVATDGQPWLALQAQTTLTSEGPAAAAFAAEALARLRAGPPLPNAVYAQAQLGQLQAGAKTAKHRPGD